MTKQTIEIVVDLETKTGREKLVPRAGSRPYWVRVSPGVWLGYRRTLKGAGPWLVRSTKGKEWAAPLNAIADDNEKADGKHVLSFTQAADKARIMARGGLTDADMVTSSEKPLTVEQAIEEYVVDLKRRGGDLANAKRARKVAGPLLPRFVEQLTVGELRARLAKFGENKKPQTVNRELRNFRAALNLAAKSHDRITNTMVWKKGLLETKCKEGVRDVNIEPEMVLTFVAAVYKRSRASGLLMDAMCETGARPSQLTRMLISDFTDGREQAILSVPKSAKGGSSDRITVKEERDDLVITAVLAAELRKAAAGRASHEPLLLLDSGKDWGSNPNSHYRRHVSDAYVELGLSPKVFTAYALRHSAIIRELKAGIPADLVAAAHNTSVKVLKRNYAKHVLKHVDPIMRRGLLDRAPADGDNVVAFAR